MLRAVSACCATEYLSDFIYAYASNGRHSRVTDQTLTCLLRWLARLRPGDISGIATAAGTAPTVLMAACTATQLAAEAAAGPDDIAYPYDPQTSVHTSQNHRQEPTDPPSLPYKRLALLIGINAYGSGQDLRGCLNDVASWRNIALTKGLRPENIRILTDEAATRTNVLAGIRWLVTDRNAGDCLFLTFSGHGSWTLTPTGHGWECCICCADCFNDWDAGIISRTDFTTAIARSTCPLTVILDSCFSGGMSPSYPAWTKLPRKARQLLYEPDGVPRLKRSDNNLRATIGPNWVPLKMASRRLGKSHDWILSQIREQKLIARTSRGGAVHVLID